MPPVQLHLAVAFVLVLAPTARGVDPKETDTNFDNHKLLAAGVEKPHKIVLYEGLPHQANEEDLFRAELKSKKTTTLNKFPFYQEPLELKTGDGKKLTTLFRDNKSFQRFGGYKFCGGFHPDYCIEWHVGKDVYRAQICFGCHEMKAFGPKTELYCDITDEGYEKLEKLLKPYRKNRPTPKE